MPEPKPCPNCDSTEEFRHLRDTAYGMPETHMAGSERYECAACDHRLSRGECASLNLEFVYD